MEKKIRITLSKATADILDTDVKSFNITKNYLINYIFEHLKEEKINEYKEMPDEKVVIQFNLNKKNKEIYYDFLKEHNIQVEADFIRKLIHKYINQPKSTRELFIFKDNVNRLKYSIENKKIIKIRFNDKRQTTILPFYIGTSKLELRNYLFCYDFEEEKYKNYKFNHIDVIYITRDSGQWKDKKFIENVIKNFDPFLSEGKSIKARLSETGKNILDNVALNRPETLSVNGDIYEFKCSEHQAKRYFSYFLDEIEILEPLELRNWFIYKFASALKKYQK
ncbi:WYL domain-containing protein [Fusobacterium sp.]|uniref:WYL domain-containing protein n=1 Tax=Fusobacterium sp. TaxID=68766 RepID=UPI00396CCF7A